jgi:hypothetical protein
MLIYVHIFLLLNIICELKLKAQGLVTRPVTAVTYNIGGKYSGSADLVIYMFYLVYILLIASNVTFFWKSFGFMVSPILHCCGLNHIFLKGFKEQWWKRTAKNLNFIG